ncbi:hypothetical protein [Prosthecobacter sp.]
MRKKTPQQRILLFGSSSLLAAFPNDPPAEIGVEVTLDADFFLDPDDEAAREELTEVLGKNRDYHNATGHYGDFVDLRLSESFPEGWRERLVPMPGFENVFALEPVDMAVTKAAATARSRLWRRLGKGGVERGMKDINTIVALLKGGRMSLDTLKKRLDGMDYEPSLIVECSQVMREIEALV